MSIICAITAGGKALRMNGLTKAFISINGQRIIDRNLKILSPLFPNIIIISNNPELFSSDYSYPVYTDYYKNIGPLAGLHTALKNTLSEAIFLISSDLPYISTKIIEILITEYQKTEKDAIIPIMAGKIEPLFGIYSKKVFHKLEQYIESDKGYAMRNFLKEVDTSYIAISNNQENRKAFYNINTPDDLREITPIS